MTNEDMRPDNLFAVRGHVAIVTGAASGLGLAMSEVLAANGATVVMADCDETRLAEHAARLAAAGGTVEALALDLNDVDVVRPRLDATIARYGRLDALFANAAISSGPGYGSAEGQVDTLSDALWDAAIRVNLTATFRTVQAAAAVMKTQKRGSIVVTSSAAALRPGPLPGHAYHATKAAVANLVRLLAMELGPYNVRVNAIAPGPFLTNIAGGRMRDPAVQPKFVAGVPMGRPAEPDEIKGLALYLASDASGYVTGAIIPIDGGTVA